MERNPFTNEEVTSVVVSNQNTAVNKFADMGFDVSVDMTSAQTQFCSMVAKTDEEKAKLYNAMNNPEKRLADCINMKIKAKDLYIEVVNCTNEETGEITACPRIVIIDDKGVAYQAVSLGIYSALKKIIQVFGAPTWDKPVTLEVKQVTKGNRKMLTLNVVA
jgi:hypothetical protein